MMPTVRPVLRQISRTTARALQVVLGRAVGEIEAHYIHPRLEHALQGFGVVRRGPEGRDDFGTASHLGTGPYIYARARRRFNGASSLASPCDTLCRVRHFASAARTAIAAQPRSICSAGLRWAVASAGCNRVRRWRGPRPAAADCARRERSASPGNRPERRRRGSRARASRETRRASRPPESQPNRRNWNCPAAAHWRLRVSSLLRKATVVPAQPASRLAPISAAVARLNFMFRF